MDMIIQYTDTFLSSIFDKSLKNITDIDELASDIENDCKTLALNILQEIIQQMNINLRQDKETRKERGLVIKEKDRPRKLLTPLGSLEFNRDYYYNVKEEKYEAPLDSMIGIQPRERIGGTVAARLVTMATEVSYAKSSEIVTGGYVSRQTVKNQIAKAPHLEKEPGKEAQKVKVLDIFADEDHVHMQKPNKQRGKKNIMVPLVTVSEGIEQVSNRRGKTVNPMHFVDENFDSNALWKSVEGYIAKAYDITQIESIRIHADGGRWIKTGLEDFTNVDHILDEFHLKQRLRDIDRRFRGNNLRRNLERAIREENYTQIETVLGNMYSKCNSEADAKAISETLTFLGSHWDAITNRYKEGMTGSCTEGQVSHLLSERFSRNPMGWSEAGLGKLSSLRIYRKNGGEISGRHFKNGFESAVTYRSYAEEIVRKELKNYDFSWMTELKEHYIMDTSSATQKAVRNLGKMHWSIS